MSHRPSTRTPVQQTADRPDGLGRLDRARFRPGLEALWRGNGELQLGSDPRCAVRLEGLTRAETRWLSSCAGSDRPLTPAALRHGIEPQRTRELLELLGDVGLLVRASRTSTPDGRGASVTATSGGGADLVALGVVHVGGGVGVLQQRAARTVVVTGTGRTGAGIATALAAAGIGSLVLRDARPVQAVDVGPGGLRLRDVGRRRDEAVAQQVADTSPATRVRVPGDHELASVVLRADLVVHVEDRAADVVRATRLVSAGVDHLPVVVQEAGTSVGPLVVPGVTPCLRCVALHRRDEDDRWPTMAVQLRQRYEGSPAPEETATAAVAAAIAAVQALAHLDGHRAHALGATIEADLPQAIPRVRAWEPHPACGCGAGDPHAALRGRPRPRLVATATPSTNT